MIDLYKILGIEYTDDQDEIHRAFRKMALKFHPDINPNGEKRFKLINKAYQILTDKDKKAKYDLEYFNHKKHKYNRKYNGENDLIFSDDEKDKYNSSVYKSTKSDFSS
jgi:DnaJ-class molecular chaperone